MKCPHCLESFFAHFKGQFLQWPDTDWLDDHDGYWHVRTTKCPSCNRAIICLELRNKSKSSVVLTEIQIWPRGIARSPLPPEVLEEFAADYKEACLVLADSPKASAALSRRCLQHLLRENAGVKPSDLSKEINQVLA